MPAVEELAEGVVAALDAFERARRDYFPGIVPRLREAFAPVLDRLKESITAYGSGSTNPARGTDRTLLRAADLCCEALRLSVEADWMEQSLVDFRKAGRRICRVQERLYPLCPVLPPINRFFLEEKVRDRAETFIRDDGAASSPAGLVHLGLDEDPYARGGLSLYIPEYDDGSRPLPLVVALHGGFGHGRDFIWTWLREARSRCFIVAAPCSRGPTWTITGHDFDALLLQEVLETLCRGWNVDRKRILITGLSDGGTYALVRAVDEVSPFSAYAVVSGILPPFDLRHVKGRRIYWVHGAKDWMFPLRRAKTGEKELAAAGADVTLKIVPDLYHAYPREQNDGMLAWFDPALAL